MTVAALTVGGCASPRMCNGPEVLNPRPTIPTAVVVELPKPPQPVPARLIATVAFDNRYAGATEPDADSLALLKALANKVRDKDFQLSRIHVIALVQNLGRQDADWMRALRRTDAVREILERNGVDPLLVQGDQRFLSFAAKGDDSVPLVRACLRWIKHRCHRWSRPGLPARVQIVVDGFRTTAA